MKFMSDEIVNMGQKKTGKVVSGIGEMAIKLGEQARGRCLLALVYEPKMPMELLKENIEK